MWSEQRAAGRRYIFGRGCAGGERFRNLEGEERSRSSWSIDRSYRKKTKKKSSAENSGCGGKATFYTEKSLTTSHCGLRAFKTHFPFFSTEFQWRVT